MKARILLAVLVGSLAVSSASATQVDVDFLAVLNGGTPMLGDDFAGATLDMPPWFIGSGAPGPVAGSFLTMHDGDLILAPLTVDPLLETNTIAQLNLTDFPAGSSVTLFLLAPTGGNTLALVVTPGAAALVDSGNLVGLVAMPLAGSSTLALNVGNGTVSALINGNLVGFGATNWTETGGVGLAVTAPEPATAGLLGAGLAGTTLLRRRRRQAGVPDPSDLRV